MEDKTLTCHLQGMVMAVMMIQRVKGLVLHNLNFDKVALEF
jgi:hypothetical protein